MRIVITAAVASFVLAGAAAAAEPTDSPIYSQGPAYQAQAFLGLSFGGAKAPVNSLHYGLRFDPRSAGERPFAPHMELDLASAPSTGLRLNGMPVLAPLMALHQTDQPAATPPPADSSQQQPAQGSAPPAEQPPAEQPGFFGRMWNGIKGLFGGGDEKKEEKPTETAQEGGSKGGWTVGDYAALSIGLVGLAFVANEELGKGKNNQDPKSISGPVSMAAGRTSSGAACRACNALTGPADAAFAREELDLLDGGTGRMGDLVPRN